MIEIKPPATYEKHMHLPKIFLAGSIDMGAAIDWQKEVAARLSGHDVLILNPRRDNWDSSWEQVIENDQFRGQVEWELDALDAADLILIYFAPNSKAPVTFLEFGLHAVKRPKNLLVCCPKGFWRKGNVDIVCRRYGVTQAESLDDMIEMAKNRLQKVA